jgi:hypothetical protein
MTILTATAGVPIHVTAYINNIAVNPSMSMLSWSGLPSDASVVADMTGFNFVFNTVNTGSGVDVTAHDGLAQGVLTFIVQPPVITFSSP